MTFFIGVLHFKTSVNREQKPSKNVVRVEGIVEESYPSAFRVKIGPDKEVLAHLSGRMRMNHIRIMPGDRVAMEMLSREDERGRIVKRL